MRIERIFIADDGTEFSNERDCQEYEDNLRNGDYQCLNDYIHFYNRVGNPIPYSRLRNSLVYYAKVDLIPVWSEDQVVRAWEDIIPEELADQIDCCGAGWYISDGDDNWKSWENYYTEFSNHNEIINKIICEGK